MTLKPGTCSPHQKQGCGLCKHINTDIEADQTGKIGLCKVVAPLGCNVVSG